jgi:hypothetical protein
VLAAGQCAVSQTHARTHSVGQGPGRSRPVPIHGEDVAAPQTGLEGELGFERHRLGVVVGHDLAGVCGFEPGLERASASAREGGLFVVAP